MEYFYRDMRHRTELLIIADSTPEDVQVIDNRDTPRGVNYPALERLTFDAITKGVPALVALERFVTDTSPGFGRYVDAMLASAYN